MYTTTASTCHVLVRARPTSVLRRRYARHVLSFFLCDTVSRKGGDRILELQCKPDVLKAMFLTRYNYHVLKPQVQIQPNSNPPSVPSLLTPRSLCPVLLSLLPLPLHLSLPLPPPPLQLCSHSPRPNHISRMALPCARSLLSPRGSPVGEPPSSFLRST